MVEVDEMWRYSGVAAESNGRIGGAVRQRHRRIARSHEDVFRASKLDRAGTKFAIEAVEGFRTRSRDLDLSVPNPRNKPARVFSKIGRAFHQGATIVTIC